MDFSRRDCRLFFYRTLIKLLLFSIATITCTAFLLYFLPGGFPGEILLLLNIPLGGLVILVLMRYREYLRWARCLELRFSDKAAEENFDFGVALQGNFDHNLGELVWSSQKGFKVYESGIQHNFFFEGDGLQERKRWEDIERISIIPCPPSLFRTGREYWLKIETLDLKWGVVRLTEREKDEIIDILKRLMGEHWKRVFAGERKNESLFRHSEYQRYRDMII